MGWTPPPQPTPFNTKPEDVLFLDIETVPKVDNFADLDEFGKAIFKKKFLEIGKVNPEELVYIDDVWKNKAALYTEFNKIACVSMGVFTPGENGERTFRIKSFFGFNEAMILQQLAPKLGKAKFLCAHNGKKFDFPVMARKYVQHGLPIPAILNVTGVKPWDVNHFDTLELWQFNDLKNFTSLDALAYVFGLDSSKAIMNGAGVAEIYFKPLREKGATDLPWEYEREALLPIATYCEGDVVNLGNIFLRMIGQPIVQPENIVVV